MFLRSLYFLYGLSLFWSLTFIQAQSLQDLLIPIQNKYFFVYRWSSQVAIIDPSSENIFESLSLQIPLKDYYRKKTDLATLLLEKGKPLGSHPSLLKKLLLSPIERDYKAPTFCPNLTIFKKLGLKPEWKAWKITLTTPFEEAPELKFFRVYTASGKDLKEAGLPENWPYWIENDDTIHKWAMYLMDIETK